MDEMPSFLTEETDVAEPEVVEVAPEQAVPMGEQEPVATPATLEAETPHVPVSALKDERGKRQAAERRAEELDRRLAELERRVAPAQKEPDVFEDPEGRFQRERQFAALVAQNTKLEMSRFMAEKDFGADEVEEAYRFFDENPHLSHQLLQSASPFHAAVNLYKRQKFVQSIGDDPDAWLEQQIAARMQAAAPPVQNKPAAPPPSVASATPAGAATAPPVSGFDALFGG